MTHTIRNGVHYYVLTRDEERQLRAGLCSDGSAELVQDGAPAIFDVVASPRSEAEPIVERQRVCEL